MKLFKHIAITGGMLILVIGILAGIKGLQIGRMVARGEAYVQPPETVTVAQVRSDAWENVLTAVGSMQAVQGVVMTAELPGRITHIAFESGSKIRAGSLVLQQDISAESAEQRVAQSEVLLARKNLERASQLLPEKVISKSAFDDNQARYDQAVARLDTIRAAIAKKTVKAPFEGRLGIRQVNLGEFLEVGQPIVSLQSLNPIYVNFLLPQHRLRNIQKGLVVRMTTDADREREFYGAITAINAEVDGASRNIRVQATLKNPGEELRPGMYATVAVVLPEKKQVLAIPISAVLYAPYSDSVFVVEHDSSETRSGQLAVRQQFVQLGEKHGDYVAVRSGLLPGQTVVSTGVFKLRNGQPVVIDNSVSPEFNLDPRPEDA